MSIVLIFSNVIALKGKPCKLAVESITNIIGYGTVIENVAPNSVVHGVPLGIHNYRVSIDVCFDDDDLLPITIGDDPVKVKDFVGSHVAWPRSLVIDDRVKVS